MPLGRFATRDHNAKATTSCTVQEVHQLNVLGVHCKRQATALCSKKGNGSRTHLGSEVSQAPPIYHNL